MPDHFEFIRLDRRDDGVAILTLNRPAKLNAFNQQMIAEWTRAIGMVAEDPGIRVIVLTGAGRAFCAGGDAEDMTVMRDADNATRRNYLRAIQRIPLAMERLEKPVIAAVNGTARGAGFDMAIMCDLRVAGESATFAESYINMGVVAGDGGMYFLPRIIGTARALELFWTGRAIGAAEAERMGLLNRIVPDGEVLEVALKMAADLARQPQEAVRIIKRSVYESATSTLAAHLDGVASHMAVLFGTTEFRERLKAFTERRK